MTKIDLKFPPGATLLNPGELADLLPNYITTQGELNTLERENILEAVNWAHKKKRTDFLNATFCFELHKKMFYKVWKWAGQTRVSNKNIGVDKLQINSHLMQLFENAKYWLENHTFEIDEIAVRFHHELVRIHPFVNGNGRHARLMTDILLQANGQDRFTWGSASSQEVSDVESLARKQYLEGLRAADEGDFEKLNKFVRS